MYSSLLICADQDTQYCRAKINHLNNLLFVLNQIFNAVGVDSTFYRCTLQWQRLLKLHEIFCRSFFNLKVGFVVVVQISTNEAVLFATKT